MANSVHQDKFGPFWPLGNIVVVTPGTYVSIMSLVDSAFVNAPETATKYGGTSGEYTMRAQQITFQAFKAGAGPPKLTYNTGNIYIVKKPLAGAGGISDVGTVLEVLIPGQTWSLGSAALNRNVFSLYELYIDADTAADACQVLAIIQ
jgi:hypothetical protein